MNIYSDSLYSVLKYLKDTKVCIQNLLIITGNFNIYDNLQDLLFSHYFSISNNLLIIADLFNLELSNLTNQVPTRYSNNDHDSNSVIDLIFLCNGSSKLDNYSIYPNWQLISDYAPLIITISIVEEYINSRKCSIIKDSKEELTFIKNLIISIRNFNTSNLLDKASLDRVVNEFANTVESTWEKNSKVINITKHSKSWQDENCSKDLEKYRSSKSLENWKHFQRTVKNTKHLFFDLKIQEIANKKQGPWELINQVNKCKLPAIEVIKYNSQLYLEINNLWHALHSSFNMAQHQYIDEDVLNKIALFMTSIQNLFLEEEFTSTIIKSNSSSTPGPDKLVWRYLKHILKNKLCLKNIINITNACLDIGYWPSHFKMSTTIVIPKPNKVLYNTPKSFRPIVLLKTLGKLIEKVISDRLQFHAISNNFIYQSQLGGLKFKSTSDASITLTHFICIGQVRHLSTNILAFNISQFFLLLNYHLLTLILGKVGFNLRVVKFFLNYLVSRKTQYF